MRLNSVVHVGSEARHAVVARPAPDDACDFLELGDLPACTARRALQQRHEVAQALSTHARAHSSVYIGLVRVRTEAAVGGAAHLSSRPASTIWKVPQMAPRLPSQ